MLYKREDGQLTVAELIADLQTCPPDAQVRVEGCDGCYGAAKEVQIDETENMVIVALSKSE